MSESAIIHPSLYGNSSNDLGALLEMETFRCTASMAALVPARGHAEVSDAETAGNNP